MTLLENVFYIFLDPLQTIVCYFAVTSIFIVCFLTLFNKLTNNKNRFASKYTKITTDITIVLVISATVIWQFNMIYVIWILDW